MGLITNLALLVKMNFQVKKKLGQLIQSLIFAAAQLKTYTNQGMVAFLTDGLAVRLSLLWYVV